MRKEQSRVFFVVVKINLDLKIFQSFKLINALQGD